MRELPKSISAIPEINFNSQDRYSLDDSMKVLFYFLGKISVNRKLEIEEELDNLFSEHYGNEVIKNIIEQKIGYKKFT